ncbi:MAG: nucleoside deaminase [Chitinophagaceae bacterium]|nr:nucleoside deaminase [Chitinophagaceae bacterium]MCW5926127.1 nucleoside deaminase [Chitinophagaceae bacterium]
MDDLQYMRQALMEAQRAYEAGEVPVGAVVVMQNRIIARGHNQVETLNDPTAHAEMIALTSAFSFLGGKYLPEASIYITVEPCLMCAGALYWSKIGRIVFGASDEKNGSISKPPFREHPTVTPFHPRSIVVRGVLEEECALLMKNFFKERR